MTWPFRFYFISPRNQLMILKSENFPASIGVHAHELQPV